MTFHLCVCVFAFVCVYLSSNYSHILLLARIIIITFNKMLVLMGDTFKSVIFIFIFQKAISSLYRIVMSYLYSTCLIKLFFLLFFLHSQMGILLRISFFFRCAFNIIIYWIHIRFIHSFFLLTSYSNSFLV